MGQLPSGTSKIYTTYLRIFYNDLNNAFQAGIDKRINNFSNDIKDSVAYAHLINQIAPKNYGVTTAPLNESNLTQRADGVLNQADKIGCRAFVTPDDITHGVDKLNLAFVANLFNSFPGLEDPEDDDLDKYQETREEKSKSSFMYFLVCKKKKKKAGRL